MKKKFFSVFFAFCTIFSIFSQNSSEVEDLALFEDGKVFFENQNYGEAVKNLNSAKTARIKKITNKINTLEKSLSPAEVKYSGPHLTDKLPILREREDWDAISIIEYYLNIYSLDFFENNPENLIEFLKKLKNYPEADFLLGKIFMIEGEYDIAEKYFSNAYKSSDVLSIPDEKYEILYSLAELCENKKDFNKMEEYLLLIVSKEPLYRDNNRKKAFENTISSSKNDCVERFFSLYRAQNYQLVKPFFKLAEFYQNQNENKKSLYANALGIVTGFSKIIDIIKKRDPNFEYKDLKSFLLEVQNYSDIVNWGIENSLWKSFNLFAENAYKNSDIIFSRELYKILSEANPEEYWKSEAKIKVQDMLVN